MATKKLLELAESTSPGDSDILMIEDTVATKRITFLNLFNKVKAKLALATVATSGKASDLSGLATVATSGKLADTTKDANNRTITDAERAKWNGYGTDITSLNSNIQATNDLIWDTGYVPQPYYFGVPTGEAALVITSDGAMWYIASLSSSFNIVKMNDITTTHTVTGNASDRVITVRSSTAGNIRLTRIHLKPRYK